MPTYTFLNKDTGEYTTEIMSISSRETFLNENPQFEQVILQAPALGGTERLNMNKVPGDFRDMLSRIKGQHHGSTIDSGNISQI